MWSKTPRQTCFDIDSQTPGPGAYNPKDVKKTAPNALPFGKQTERFKRDDSSLSTCSNSTTSSARSTSHAVRHGRIQERLRTFEAQIRERDQIVARLKMDKRAALSRCQMLIDAYKQLRRVSVQSIPSQKLPKDISQDMMRALEEEKQQSKDEPRPSMTEADIKSQMATFIVEIEENDNPRLKALESEKAALEVTLEESKNRIERLQEENLKLKTEIGDQTREIGQLTGSLQALEARNSDLKNQLHEANATINSMNSTASSSQEKVFATLKELAEAKGSLEILVAEKSKQLDETEAKYDRTVKNFELQLESRANEVRDFEQKLNQLAISLRSSQDERERLARELSNTVENLEKIVHENSNLALRTNSVQEELGELKRKCKERKAELLSAEDRLAQEKSKFEDLSRQLSTSRNELEDLKKKMHSQEEEATKEKQVLQSQLKQSQDNFERQLEEARKANETLENQRLEMEKELKLAVNRMRTLENQVQTRDELLAEAQVEKENLLGTKASLESEIAVLAESATGARAERAKVEENIRDIENREQQLKKELSDLTAQFVDLELLKNAKDAEITALQLEVSQLKRTISELQETLRNAIDETSAERKKLRSLEQETSSIRLLHLATTAELEQTKAALENAVKNNARLDSLKLELAAAEAQKARLEEQVESWIRVRDSLSKQLSQSEEKYKEALESHVAQMEQREKNIKVLEDHISSAKKAHEAELNGLRNNFEQVKEQLNQDSADHLREIREKFLSERNELSESLGKLKSENELLKNETESLIDAKATLSLQLRAKESEVLHLRNQVAEAAFSEKKCRELEKESMQLKENVTILRGDMQVTRQELMDTQQALEEAEKANEAHAMFTLAAMNAGLDSQKAEALQRENENLKQHLAKVNELLDTLETGIQTSEAKTSVYVKSYAQMQQQIQRLVGHSNNKQRIQYVGKLQTENRELKEEQAKLRSKVDSQQKKISQMELQLRKFKDKENRPETIACSSMSTTQSHFY